MTDHTEGRTPLSDEELAEQHRARCGSCSQHKVIDRLRAENAALAARIETALAHIRKCIHIGLQDAKLYDETGEKRIGEWADFIDREIRAALRGDQDGGGEQ